MSHAALMSRSCRVPNAVLIATRLFRSGASDPRSPQVPKLLTRC